MTIAAAGASPVEGFTTSDELVAIFFAKSPTGHSA